MLPMQKNRLEAFSDGVLAIIITIMVLELKVPHDPTIDALRGLAPAFSSYILSFVYVGIYWNNHHHLFHAVTRVSGPVLWANLHLLFWLSLVPFASGWMGENHFDHLPVLLYGAVLLMSGVAYFVLSRALISHQGADSALAVALGRDRKGKLSVAFYLLAIALSFVDTRLSLGLYVLVALMWVKPDQRIEHSLID